jgi:hypothetical protein
MKEAMTVILAALAVFGFALGIVILILAISAGFGALTMVALSIFGIHTAFWKAWALYIVLSAIFQVVTSKEK